MEVVMVEPQKPFDQDRVRTTELTIAMGGAISVNEARYYLCSKIRDMRRAQKIPMEHLSKYLGYSSVTVSQIEDPDTRPENLVSPSALAVVAKALGFDTKITLKLSMENGNEPHHVINSDSVDLTTYMGGDLQKYISDLAKDIP